MAENGLLTFFSINILRSPAANLVVRHTAKISFAKCLRPKLLDPLESSNREGATFAAGCMERQEPMSRPVISLLGL